jgi:prepilin-type processing-associated H-X9-DG protein
MQSPLQSPSAATDPKSVKVNLSTGAGVDIVWADGHVSHYSFAFLRDACPCAMCNEERDKSNRKPGEPAKVAAGALPMFKAAAKPVSAEGMGKYAIRFHWNDGHDLGIYSWKLLRELCACEECKAVVTNG